MDNEKIKWKSEFNKKPDTLQDIDEPETIGKISEDIINDSNENIIFEQFKENEVQNRHIKCVLLVIVSIFSFFQLLGMTIIVLIVVIGLVVDDNGIWFIHKIDTSVCEELFEFLRFYISATIVELLGMLYFIVKRVFDNNVAKMFDINNKKKKDKKIKTEK